MALIHICKDTPAALEALAGDDVDAVVLHRTHEHNAVSLIRKLRGLKPDLIIIAVSGIDRTDQVLAAGATAFLNYDRWLLLGPLLSDALAEQHEAANTAKSRSMPA